MPLDPIDPSPLPDPLVRKARRASRTARTAEVVQLVTYPMVVVLVALGLIVTLHSLGIIRLGQQETHETLTTLQNALKGGPAAQDAAIRQLLGCSPAPAKCPNLRQLIEDLGVQEISKLDALISRPSTTRVVTVAGRTRTIVVTRTITRTVVVCRTPSGKPC